MSIWTAKRRFLGENQSFVEVLCWWLGGARLALTLTLEPLRAAFRRQIADDVTLFYNSLWSRTSAPGNTPANCAGLRPN